MTAGRRGASGEPVLLEDPRAPHQIRLRQRKDRLTVSCTCLNTWDGTWQMAWKTPWASPGWRGARLHGAVIEARARFPAADAIAAWRAWHAERGVIV